MPFFAIFCVLRGTVAPNVGLHLSRILPTVGFDGGPGTNADVHGSPWYIVTLSYRRDSKLTRYPAFQMSLDFVGAEFFGGQNSGITPDLSSPSSSSAIPSSSAPTETSKLDHPKYTGSPLSFPALAAAEQSFDWGENFIIPTNGIAPAQTIQDPSMLLAREWIQKATTHSMDNFPPGDGSSFVMTCPLPLCSHQSSELISIWRHITWDHLGDTNKCSRAMTELVEKVVLGAGEG